MSSIRHPPSPFNRAEFGPWSAAVCERATDAGIGSVEAEVAHLVMLCRRYRVSLTCADIAADRFAPDVTREGALSRLVAALAALARTPPAYDRATTRGMPATRAS